MNKLFIAILIITLISCSSRSLNNSVDTIKKNIKPASSDSLANDDLPPSQAEERERLSKTYDDVETVDSTFIDDKDTLKFHMKYYCLKNTNLIIPKYYEGGADGDKNAKDFLTHPFVMDITLLNKRDTVLNKHFKVNDFFPFFKDNFGGALKKYGSIIGPGLSRRNKDKNRIMVVCSISIPSTDLGIGMDLIIDKSGHYEIPKYRY